MDAKKVIETLGLKPLPGEGGFFRETYRAVGELSSDSLRGNYEGSRSFSTAIYFLVTAHEFSALHRIVQDEVLHFYLGDPVDMIRIDPAGRLETLTLGPRIDKGEHLQIVVPGGHWQGLQVKKGGGWSLLGATVAPGFDFRDIVLGEREKLLKEFPQHKEEIVRFTQ